MRCPVILSIPLVFVLGCTQDFSLFELPGNTFESTSGNGAGPTSGATSSGATGGGGNTATGTTGATTTTAATTTSAASGAGGALSSSSTGLPEDCVNGVDDDGDGDIDCADTDCDAGFTCVPTVPKGWNGPVALYAGDPAGKPLACPSERPSQAYQGNSGLVAAPASCAPCACAAPAVPCVAAPLQFENATCTAQVGSATQPLPGTCQTIAPPGATKALKASAPTASACAASGGQATLPSPTWQVTALACTGSALGAGCGAQATCAPRTEAPFEPGLCVYRSGNQNCPASFPVKLTFTDNVNDARACTACACDSAGVQCSATTSIYTANSCSGAHADVGNDGSCVPFPGGASVQVTVTKSGSCTPSGGQPTGTITEGNLKTTVCCAP